MRSGAVAKWTCRWLTLLTLLGCSVPPQTGWEERLRDELVDVAQRFAAGATILTGFAPAPSAAEVAPLAVGDQLLFGVSIERGADVRTWFLRLQVVALEVASWTRIRVDAFDAEVRPLASAETSAALEHLQRIHAACLAGRRQQLRRSEGAELAGHDGTDEAHADTVCVNQGVGACRLLFRLLEINPVTRDILLEVLALPTLWSIVSTLRVRADLTVDFLAAQPVDDHLYAAAKRPLWSVPAVVLLNDQPALHAFVVAGPDGAPDGAAAGVVAIVGRHPTDAQRRVFVQLIASRRAVASEPSPDMPTTAALSRRVDR